MSHAIRDAATAAAKDPVGKTWEEIALAALRAIREPTKPMLIAGNCHWTAQGNPLSDISVGLIFADMIDAAIAEAGAQE
jgi:hypothetical protein